MNNLLGVLLDATFLVRPSLSSPLDPFQLLSPRRFPGAQCFNSGGRGEKLS